MTHRFGAAEIVGLVLALNVLGCGKLKISLNDQKKKKEEPTIETTADASGKRKLLAIPSDFIERAAYEQGGISAELGGDGKASGKKVNR